MEANISKLWSTLYIVQEFRMVAAVLSTLVGSALKGGLRAVGTGSSCRKVRTDFIIIVVQGRSHHQCPPEDEDHPGVGGCHRIHSV